MLHSEFQIGLEFMCGQTRWRCTDIGTRTIAAISLENHDESWFVGPPYAVSELVFDEHDMPVCHPMS